MCELLNNVAGLKVIMKNLWITSFNSVFTVQYHLEWKDKKVIITSECGRDEMHIGDWKKSGTYIINDMKSQLKMSL